MDPKKPLYHEAPLRLTPRYFPPHRRVACLASPPGCDVLLGWNLATGMDTALLPTIELVNADPDGDTTSSDYLLFTYRRSDLSVAAGVTVDCETDTDLVAPWTAATGAPGVVILVDNNFTFSPPAAADTDRVRVYVPRGANTKLFGRLNAIVP